jgi:hypothetical protein
MPRKHIEDGPPHGGHASFARGVLLLLHRARLPSKNSTGLQSQRSAPDGLRLVAYASESAAALPLFFEGCYCTVARQRPS